MNEEALRRAGVQLIPSQRSAPLGLDFAAFLPKAGPGAGPLPRRLLSSDAVASLLADERGAFMSVLQRRLTELKVTSSMWAGGNLRSTLSHLVKAGDASLTADFLRTVDLQSSAIKLESCVTLLPLVVDLLSSAVEDYALVALRALTTLYRGFGPVVRDNAHLGSGVGSTIASEERASRARAAQDSLSRARGAVVSLSRRPGVVGVEARALKATLAAHFAS